MTLPLWGQMNKSQDNPQTIDEAIAAAVQAHNEDSESHLGSGESLEEHKTEPIIDHPQGSVLADKQTMTEMSISTIFESLDGWSKIGDVSNNDIPGVLLYVEDGWQNNSSLSTSPQVPANFRNSDFDMLFQVQARFNFFGTSFSANLGFYSSNSVTPEGFGFVVNSGVLTAYAKQGGNVNQSSAISLDLKLDHIYRAFLDATAEKIYFFVDGVAVATLDIPGIGWEDDVGPNMWVGRGSEDDGNLRVGILVFSREI
jgi:hypothetical protein